MESDSNTDSRSECDKERSGIRLSRSEAALYSHLRLQNLYNYIEMARYSSYSKAGYKPRSIRRYESRARNRLVATLIISLSLLVIFVVWGLPALVNGLSILNNFKPKAAVSSVEDTAIAPPVLYIPFEATNSATIRISGYASANSKVEVYLDEDLKDIVSVAADGTFITDPISLSLGKNNIYGKTVNNRGKKSLASKTIQLIYNNEKPKLELSSPPDNQQIQGGDKKITVSGQTDPLNSVTINGITAIVNQNGSFSSSVPINEGDNLISVVATDQFGNTNQVDRKVTYVK